MVRIVKKHFFVFASLTILNHNWCLFRCQISFYQVDGVIFLKAIEF